MVVVRSCWWDWLWLSVWGSGLGEVVWEGRWMGYQLECVEMAVLNRMYGEVFLIRYNGLGVNKNACGV